MLARHGRDVLIAERRAVLWSLRPLETAFSRYETDKDARSTLDHGALHRLHYAGGAVEELRS